jgi:4-hydroxyphenylpyruvate dioxygenase
MSLTLPDTGRRVGVMALTDPAPTTPAARLKGWDSIELWVGNARAMAGFLCSAFGFHVSAYAGPETGVPDKASYLLEQGQIRLAVTAGLTPDSPIWNHVRQHGDGAHDLAFVVDDATATFEAAVARGARPVEEPYELTDDQGVLRLSSVATYGETKHTFVDRSSYEGYYCPGYERTGLPPEPTGPAVGLAAIDHVVGNVEEGRLDEWVAFYEEVMGFSQLRHFDESQIATEYSALRSTVVWNGSTIVMPLNEPAVGLRKSQIQEYLDTYRGPGVQHLALRTPDIVQAIAALRARGVRFLEANEAYYDDVRTRLAFLDLPWDELQELGILVDNESDGHLLQLFTEPVSDRPTLFVEIIQRGGATGFGEGNFKALFESIEREQARRGNL